MKGIQTVWEWGSVSLQISQWPNTPPVDENTSGKVHSLLSDQSRINVASEDDVQKLFDEFWLWSHTSWALVFRTRCLGIIHGSYEHKNNEDEALSDYVIGKQTLSKLRTSFPFKVTVTNTSVVKHISLMEVILHPVKILPRVLKNGKVNDFLNDGDTWEEFLLWTIPAQLTRWQINRYVNKKDIIKNALFVLMVPNFLLQQGEKYQNNFFQILFKEIKSLGKQELLSKDSFFYSYLQEHFSSISYLKKHFFIHREESQKNLWKNVKHSTTQVDYPQRNLSGENTSQEKRQIDPGFQEVVERQNEALQKFIWEAIDILHIFQCSDRINFIFENIFNLQSIKMPNTPLEEMSIREMVDLYIAWQIDLETAQKAKKFDTDEDQSENLILYTEKLSLDQETIEKINQDYGDDEYSFRVWVFLSRTVLSTSLWKVKAEAVIHYLLPLILYPNFIVKQPPEYQKRVIEIFLINIQRLTEYSLSRADLETLFAYLKKYFPTFRELMVYEEELLDIAWLLQAFEYPRGLWYIAELKSEFQRVSWKPVTSNEDLKAYWLEDASLMLLSWKYAIDSIKEDIFPNSEKKHQPYEITHLLGLAKNTELQKQFLNICDQQTNNISSFENIDSIWILEKSILMMAIFLIRSKESLTSSVKVKYKYHLLSLLIYPQYIQKTSAKQQRRFFQLLFQLFSEEQLLGDERIYNYLQKYFWDIESLQTKIASYNKKKEWNGKRARPKKSGVSKERPKADRPKLTVPMAPIETSSIPEKETPREKSLEEMLEGAPKVTRENTRVSKLGKKYIIDSDIAVPEGFTVFICLWAKKKWTTLKEPKQFHTYTLWEAIDIPRGYHLTVWVFPENTEFNRSLYDQHSESFPHIYTSTVPKSSKKQYHWWGFWRKQDSSKKQSVKPETPTNHSTTSEAEKDVDLLQYAVTEHINRENMRIKGDVLSFDIPEWTGVLDTSGYSGEAKTRTIKIEMTGESSYKLLCFLWISQLQVTDNDLDTALKQIVTEIKRERQEAEKKKKIQEMARERKRIHGQLSEPIKKATVFLWQCQPSEIKKVTGNRTFYVWQMPRKQEFYDKISDIYKGIWYDIRFIQWEKRILDAVSINEYTFDIHSSGKVKKITCDKKLDFYQDQILRIILEWVLAVLVVKYYQDDNLATEKAEVLSRVNAYIADRASKREELVTRLKEGRASFVDGWEYHESESVGSNHPEITYRDLLWTRGHIKFFWNKIFKEETLLRNYEELFEEMEEHKGALTEYVFMRLTSTERIQNQSQEIQYILYWFQDEGLSFESDDIQKKHEFCLKVLSAMREAKIGVELIHPTSFLYEEIEEFL